MKCIKIENEAGEFYICALDGITRYEGILATGDLESLIDDGEVGASRRFTIIEMSEEEFETLPENYDRNGIRLNRARALLNEKIEGRTILKQRAKYFAESSVRMAAREAWSDEYSIMCQDEKWMKQLASLLEAADMDIKQWKKERDSENLCLTCKYAEWQYTKHKPPRGLFLACSHTLDSSCA